MPEGDQTGILTVRRLAGQHLRRAVERVALDDRNLETKLVERDIHQGIFRCVLTRSEEHTSELQSLMRISYAAFCLQKQQNAYSKLRFAVNTTITKLNQTYISV